MASRFVPHADNWTLRSDPRAHISEELTFLGSEDQRIFACTHLPLGGIKAGLLICSPLHAEFPHNYRKEVLLARALASRGIAVQRFHYRGTGNSDGAPGDTTFQSMEDDLIAAAEHLQAKSGTDRIAILGTRLAALVAAASAARFKESRLVLWEPCISAADYFREVVRTGLMRGIKDGDSGRRGLGDSLEEMKERGSIDVLGYSIHWNLYGTFLERTLLGSLTERNGEILLIQLDQSRELRPDYIELIRKLNNGGWRVESRAVPANDSWWFSGDPRDSFQAMKECVQSTSTWLLERFAGGGVVA